MDIYRHASSVMVRAPAKLNLYFELLARRSDGYHEVETLMVPISLYDTLVAWSVPGGSTAPDGISPDAIHVECQWALPPAFRQDLGQLPASRDNLATRALSLLRTQAGVSAGIRVNLTKRIPAAAGMGGGSSDAAAALLAGNAVWGLGWSRARLGVIAAQLGSDIPFFLGNGAAVCRGRGERIEPLASIGPLHFVVVRPPEGLATAQVYARCQVDQQPRSIDSLVDHLQRGDLRSLDTLIHNRLEEAAETLSPWIARVRREFAGQDCLAARMSGSGSSYFGICRHARHARAVARRLRARRIGYVVAACMRH